MATMNATWGGWRCRISKDWYGSGTSNSAAKIGQTASDSSSWKTATTQDFGSNLNPSISSTHHSNGSVTSNMYTVCIKITTPNVANITKISIPFKVFNHAGKSPTAHTGNALYGRLRTTSASTTSDNSSSWSNTVGSEWSTTAVTSGYTSVNHYNAVATFTGSFSANTNYYLFLYTKDNGTNGPAVYGMYDMSSPCGQPTVEYTETYTVSYNNGGRGTAPSSHSVTKGNSITLRGAMSAVAGTSYTVSYNANGGTSTPSTQTSTYTYTHTKWAAGSSSGTKYNPGASYTPSGNTTMYGVWSGARKAVTLANAISKSNTTATRTVTFDATTNGGTCSTASLKSTATVTHAFAGWAAGSTSGTVSAAGASYTPTANTTMYATWTPTTGNYSAITLPTASKANGSSSCTITYNANSGSVSPTSATSSRTITYTFKGWNTSKTATTGSTGSYTPTGNVTLYAIFSATNGAYGAVTLPTPTRTGYDFKGWSTDSSATSGVTGSYTPTGNVTLYATWAKKTYPINYNANGHGTAPSSQTKTYGESLTLRSFIAQNTSTGYTVSFNKNSGNSTPSSLTSTLTHTQTAWNTKADGSGTSHGSGATYTSNAAATLYAIWSTANGSVTLPAGITRNSSTATGYKVTFNANGGTCATTDLTSQKTTTYTFNKWAAGSTSGTTYAANASFTPTANTTMYATWSTTTTNGSIDLPTPTRTGYSFQGWSTSSSATSGTTGTYTPTAATTLYATWKANTYSVKYNANGHGTAPANQTKTYGTALTLQAFIGNQTGTGYTVSFNNNGGTSTPDALTSTLTYKQTYWNTASDGSGDNYSSKGSYTANTGTTLYAIWSTTKGAVTLPSSISKTATTENGYKVTLNANGGSCATTSLTATDTRNYAFNKWAAGSVSGTGYSAGGSFTPSANTTMYATWTETVTRGTVALPTATRTGYTFKGWSTSSSATSGTTGNYTPSGNVTLYAIWSANTYAISYNANGYGTAPAGQSKVHDTALTLQPFIANQTVTGYKVSFNANSGKTTPNALTSNILKKQTYWNTNSSGTGTNYNSQGSYTANSAATLYAIWESTNQAITLPAAIERDSTTENGYKVTFNANGGNCSTASLTATNTRSYTFNKWAVGSVSGTAYAAGAAFTPSAATTMYATWTESVSKGKIELPVASRTGYSFLGWSTSNTATSGTTGNYTPTGNVTLYAVWSANGYAVTYNANGYGTAPSSQTKTHDKTLVLQPFIANQELTGYQVTFNSNGGDTTHGALTSKITKKQTYWNTKADGSGTNYGSQGNYTANTGATMYAIWSTINGSITLPTPTRKNYTFKGWGTQSTSTTGVTGSYTPTANTTLYAIWEMSNSLIHYNNDGTDTLCCVYYNDNGTAVLCNVYYNDNGTAVRI